MKPSPWSLQPVTWAHGRGVDCGTFKAASATLLLAGVPSRREPLALVAVWGSSKWRTPCWRVFRGKPPEVKLTMIRGTLILRNPHVDVPWHVTAARGLLSLNSLVPSEKVGWWFGRGNAPCQAACSKQRSTAWRAFSFRMPHSEEFLGTNIAVVGGYLEDQFPFKGTAL